MTLDKGARRRAGLALSMLLAQALLAPAISSPAWAQPANLAPPPIPPPAAAPPAPPAPIVVPPPAAAPPAAPGVTGSGSLEEPDPESMTDLEVIKVTVDRREKSLQDYAGSASAYSQDDLQRVGVNSARELSHVSPSMEIGTQEGNTEIFIRGVGSTNNTELGDPTASTYIDGVYIPRPRGVGAMFFDLERVEVNRGPQGTLRGRNALAGTVNIVSVAPKLSLFGAEGSVQYGNYNQRLTRTMVNIPVHQRLALRFASFSENRNPFYVNGGPVHTLQASESADAIAYRASAKAVPIDRVTFVLSHDYVSEKGTGYSGSNFAAALAAGLLPSEVPNPRSVIYRGPQGMQNLKHWGVRGDLVVDLGPVQLQYLGSYRNLDFRQTSSGNAGVAFPGMPAPQIDNWSTSYWHTSSKSHVHELRLYAPDAARFRWTAGGFFFREKQTAFLGDVADQSNAFAGVEFNMPDIKGQSEAGYADATFDISKLLRATAGLRYTHETKSRTGIGNVYGFDIPSGMGNNFRLGTEGFRFAENRPSYDLTGMNGVDVFRQGIASFGARDTLGNALNQPGSAAASWASFNNQRGQYKDSFIDFRVGLDATPTPHNLVYATFTTGHSSGGFNDNVILPMGAGSIAPTYRPEALYASEVGSKNQLFNRKLQVNGSAFWYEYRDMVLQTVRQISPAGVSNPGMAASSAVRSNVAEARIIGVEADAAARLPRGVVASVAATYLHARAVSGALFDNRVAFGPTGGSGVDEVDISGNVLPRAPTWTVNYSLSQQIRTSIGWFDWIVSAQTRTQYYMTIFNGEGRDPAGNVAPNLSDVVPGYTRVDVGAGYTRPDGKARIDTFVTNLTDTTYMNTLINTPNLNLRWFNPPRQFGVRLSLYY
jgi:iron complex outermembrane receptor protein